VVKNDIVKLFDTIKSYGILSTLTSEVQITTSGKIFSFCELLTFELG